MSRPLHGLLAVILLLVLYRRYENWLSLGDSGRQSLPETTYSELLLQQTEDSLFVESGPSKSRRAYVIYIPFDDEMDPALALIMSLKRLGAGVAGRDDIVVLGLDLADSSISLLLTLGVRVVQPLPALSLSQARATFLAFLASSKDGRSSPVIGTEGGTPAASPGLQGGNSTQPKSKLERVAAEATSLREQQRRWGALWAWGLTEYTKVIKLSSHLLVLRAIDEIFEMPDLAAVSKGPLRSEELFEANSRPEYALTNQLTGHTGLNDALLVLKPSLTTLRDLLSKGKKVRRPTYPPQQLLYEHFDSQASFFRLPFVYNVRGWRYLQPELKRQLELRVKVFNFNEQQPWLQPKREAAGLQVLWWKMMDAAKREVAHASRDKEDIL